MVFRPYRARKLGLSLRKMEEADLPFIADLYASTRREELRATGWPESMQRAFLGQQHQAQHRHYLGAFPAAQWLVVEQAGRPIGRLYLNWAQGDVRVVDISLLAESCGAGLGRALLLDLQRQAKAEGRSVSLSVRQGNPARRLYARLGFAPVAGLDAAYEEMVWRG